MLAQLAWYRKYLSMVTKDSPLSLSLALCVLRPIKLRVNEIYQSKKVD